MNEFRRNYALLEDLLKTIENAYILDPYTKVSISRDPDDRSYYLLKIKGNFTSKKLFSDME